MRPPEAIGLCWWLLLLAWAGLATAAERVDDSHIVKPATDAREYRYRRFDNGLQLLLVHAPDAEHWRLAVDLAAGYNQEPPHPAGTAALLAHSLVQAREPLQPLLAAGQVSTRVTAEHSRIGLTLPAGKSAKAVFPGVLEALLTPEFDEQTLSRALAHMDSEFQRDLTSDQRRRSDVYCALYQSSHPLARYCQARARVEQLNAESLSAPLVAYHQRHYVPAQMAIVVSSPLPLDKLDALISPRLREIPTAEAPGESAPEPLLAEETLPVAVNIRSSEETPRLFMSFPVPREPEHGVYHPFSLVTALLENDGPGGLLWLLQDLGWAQSLQAELRPLSRHYQLYEIDVDLTDLGVRARDQVVALVFYQLGQIRDRGLEAWRYNELAQLADLDFRFDQTPDSELWQLAQRLHEVSPQHLLYEPYRYAPFDAELHTRYLNHLTSDNVIVAYTGSDVSAESLSPLLAAPYARQSLTPEQPDIKISVRRKLSFPDENAFIPKRLNVKEEQLLPTPSARMEPATGPVRIVEKPRFHAWYQQDVAFKVPRSSVFVRVDSPAAVVSAEAAVSTRLLAALLERQLHASVHQARSAGFDFTLQAQPQGLLLSLSGYSSQQGLMLTRVGQVMTEPHFDEEIFERARRHLQKSLKAQPVTPEAQIAQLLVSPHWSSAQLLNALEQVDYQAFTRFARHFFDGVFIRSFYYGNLYRQEAQRLATLTEHYLSRPGSDGLPQRRLLRLEGVDEEAVWRLPMTAPSPPSVHLYVQAGGTTPDDRARMALLSRWLPELWAAHLPSGDDSLHLQVKPLNLLGYPGVLISLSALRTDTDTLENWLQGLLAVEWPENAWRQQAQHLQAHWQQPPDTQRQQAQRLWYLIDRHQADFDLYREQVRALDTLDHASLWETYTQLFADPTSGLWLLAPDSQAQTPPEQAGTAEPQGQRPRPVYTLP